MALLRFLRSSLIHPKLAFRPLKLPHRLASYIPASNKFFRVSEEVQEALQSGKPVVSLETTIYTHGFPHPQNAELARDLELIVRENGAVPATIGVIDGVARVGLSQNELDRLTSLTGDSNTLKVSRRDLAYACGAHNGGRLFNGGTTVAATALLSHLAGISVFATGGLGGVHKGAESSMDISADLVELGRTPIAVISSGCKSFLDIGRTLEVLETQGVGVATFADGRQGKVDFPAFWSRESGWKSPLTIKDEEEAARMIHAQMSLPVSSALLFANPIPEEAAIPRDQLETIIADAIRAATEHGAEGRDNTPFILSAIVKATNGQSMVANRSLVASNVRRGAIIARELSRIGKDINTSNPAQYDRLQPSPEIQRSKEAIERQPQATIERDSSTQRAEVVVAGAMAIDYACDFMPIESNSPNSSPALETSNPARISQSLGGVAHNIAKAIHFCGSRVELLSLVGGDPPGRSALAQLSREGLRTSGIQILEGESSGRTSQYVAINDTKKDLVIAMADMGILESPSLQKEKLVKQLKNTQPKWFVADANWASSTLHHLFQVAKEEIGAQTIFEPVSCAKSTRILNVPASPPLFPSHLVDIATPNVFELSAMNSFARAAGLFDQTEWFSVIDAMDLPSSGIRSLLERLLSASFVDQGIPQQAIQLLPFIPTIITKLGPRGIILTKLLSRDDDRLRDPATAEFIVQRSKLADPNSKVGGLYMRWFKPERVFGVGEVVSVNGVGDTFAGAMIARLVGGDAIEDAIKFGMRAAECSLRSREAVSPELKNLK